MIIERIHEWAVKDPQSTAVLWNGQAISYARFAQAIETVQRRLSAQSLRPGSTAVVAMLSLLDTWTVVLALRGLGLNTVAVLGLDVAQGLELDDVGCLVVDPIKSSGVASARKQWPQASVIFMPQAVCNALSEPAAAPPRPALRAAVGSHILYTSGTTGQYKKLRQNTEQEAAQAEARAEVYGLRAQAPWFVGSLGLWTAVGYKMPLVAWHRGGSVVFDQRENWVQNFLAQPCDALLVPDMVAALLQQAPADRAPGDWRLWVTSGFLSVSRAQAIASRLTRRLAISYGSTELCAPALVRQVDHVQDMHWLQVVPGREVQICDEQGLPCGPGVEGLLRVGLQPMDARAYMGDEPSSHKVFRDGFFYPGDMAVGRADGCIRVLGRSADVLNLQGRKLAVAPLEQAIVDRLGVSAVCLFNTIDTLGRDQVLVALESSQRPTAQELDWLHRQLLGFEHIRVVLRARFPRTNTGTSKVNRTALRREFLDQT